MFLKTDVVLDSPLNAVSKTLKEPILFIHSQDDEVIPFAQAKLLQEASAKNPNAEFWYREELGHGYLGSREYQQRIKVFFAGYL